MTDVLEKARAGDEDAFTELVAGHRRELLAHCYRMLGSRQDAEDALQETLVAAWRGLAGFEERSSLRTWLYRIATNSSLRLADKRGPRVLSWDHGPARDPGADLGAPVDRLWLEPWVGDVPEGGDPAAAYDARESIELAYVAALQHLPGNQRAVLILRDVLAYSAAETAELLDTSSQSVNSALQRARATLADRGPTTSQQVELAGIDQQAVIDAFVAAWERADVDALVELLAEDVRFTMPPLPAWFDGLEDVAGFMRQRLFAAPWRLRPTTVNAQPAFACYSYVDEVFRLAAVNVLSFHDGRISWIATFVDPEFLAGLGLPASL